MGIYRRPVSARRSIKSRKAQYKSKTSRSKGTSKNGSVKTPGRITGLSRSDFGFPDRLRTKLQYCDVIQLAASAGSPALYQFRMASLYDPDVTSTGHQPQWYDQLSAVYSFYKVLSSKITATFIPNNINDTEANDTGPYIVGITMLKGTSSLASANYPALLEDGDSVSDVIVDKQGANNMKTLTNTFSPMRDVGVWPYSTDNRVAVTTNVNSTTDGIATVWALDMTEFVAQNCTVRIQIEYDCEFDCRRTNVVS